MKKIKLYVLHILINFMNHRLNRHRTILNQYVNGPMRTPDRKVLQSYKNAELWSKWKKSIDSVYLKLAL